MAKNGEIAQRHRVALLPLTTTVESSFTPIRSLASALSRAMPFSSTTLIECCRTRQRVGAHFSSSPRASDNLSAPTAFQRMTSGNGSTIEKRNSRPLNPGILAAADSTDDHDVVLIFCVLSNLNHVPGPSLRFLVQQKPAATGGETGKSHASDSAAGGSEGSPRARLPANATKPVHRPTSGYTDLSHSSLLYGASLPPGSSGLTIQIGLSALPRSGTRQCADSWRNRSQTNPSNKPTPHPIKTDDAVDPQCEKAPIVNRTAACR